MIKQQFEQYRIKRLVGPLKTFPIEQSYIDLAIVDAKEQKEKETKLRDMNFSDATMSTYEALYGTKTVLEAKDIFEKYKDTTKKVLVLGRAGVGKTIFCQYIAHQWATGKIWPQFELVFLIPLRHLTADCDATKETYSPVSLAQNEYFRFVNLPEGDEIFFNEQYKNGKILWLLDGYYELTKNIPETLKNALDDVLATQHHIITSRSYSNTLSYDVELEITGFTDDKIVQYVKQFFELSENNASFEDEELLTFLKFNPRLLDVAHSSINLELICSLWINKHLSKTKELTMTGFYDNITEWLCRQYLEKQNKEFQTSKQGLFERCSTELAVLETLAFKGMKKNRIILHKELLEETLEETKYPSEQFAVVLNIGILKSLDDKLISTQIDVEKDYYFMPFSFQEYFAARYLVNALNGTADQKQKAVDFIKTNKYNQRFESVFSFTSGLLIDYNKGEAMTLFWETSFGEPLDLIGFRHVQIVIVCLEEAGCRRQIPRFGELMNTIIKWIKYYIFVDRNKSGSRFIVSLQRSPILVDQPEIHDKFIEWYKDKDRSISKKASSFISDLPISDRYTDLIQLHLTALNGKNTLYEWDTLQAVCKMGEKVATNEVIKKLIILLGDTNSSVKRNAVEALGRMGEKAVTDDVINELVNLLDETDKSVKRSTCEALGRMGEKAATDEVINKLLILLGNEDEHVRQHAFEALENMGEKVATNQVINRLLILLDDTSDDVKRSACEALGRMGEKAATNEVIHRLFILVGDTNDSAKRRAREALNDMGKNAATNEVINELIFQLRDRDYRVIGWASRDHRRMDERATINKPIDRLLTLLDHMDDNTKRLARNALQNIRRNEANNEMIDNVIIILDDTDRSIRRCACEAFGNMGEKAATDEVINKLSILLGDSNVEVIKSVCEALGKMGEKAATNEVINKLINLLGDSDYHVKHAAYETLFEMSEKAATDEVINKLINVLYNSDHHVRHSVYETLGKMNEKTITDEVTSKLVRA
ncbi:unnamed protein product [Adineta steineri]|uniref:NACHT domain-containing protein n=1 Tax=Adineta steineri TaxID=433720 RepID=A0A818HV89_9BILA|nr:unnamed protein product [Adineta steineri]